MNTEISKLVGISIEWLQRYVEMRSRFEVEANSIFSITSMLELLESCGDDRIEVDPIALGKISQMLKKIF